MDSLLTTGEVAKLCGVTPDAVLKWIKKGRLPATRTAGGHYRVSRDTCVALGLFASNGDEPLGAPRIARPDDERRLPRCWEYFGQPGTPPATCRNCLVYQARVQHCYKLAELGEHIGQTCEFCRMDCMDCPFYRACHGLATTVLVITRDEALARRLQMQIDARKVSLHFARSGYDASMLVGALRPAMVVLDSRLLDISEDSLAACIGRDDRVPGLKIFVARRQGDEEVVERLAVPVIAPPFTAERIERLAEKVVGAGRKARGDAA